MAGAMMNMLPNYFNVYINNALFLYLDCDYSKYITTEEYAVSQHDSTFCRYDDCKYHVILIGDVEKILQQLQSHRFHYLWGDCFYAICKFLIFNGKQVIRVGGVIDEVHQAIRYNRMHPHMESQPSIIRKKLIRKVRKLNSGIILRKHQHTQTLTNSFYKRIETILESDDAADFMKITDCFHSGGGIVQSKRVAFTM